MLKNTLILNFLIGAFTISGNVKNFNFNYNEKTTSIIQRIEGGQDIEENEYPWFSFLEFYSVEKERASILGCAALIDSEWILSSGHIGRYFEDFKQEGDQLFANFKMYNFNNLENVKKIAIDQVVIHPYFNNNTFEQKEEGVDLALMHLSQPIYDIVPIRLLTNYHAKFSLSNAIVLGQPNEQNEELKSQKLELYYVDNKNAKKLYGDRLFKQPLYSEANDFFLSSLTNDKLIDPGDSGGPVIKVINDVPTLIGVIKGSPQNITDPSRVFIATGVNKQYQWIASNIFQNEQAIINQYTNNNYLAIFNSHENPKINNYGPEINSITGQYSGDVPASTEVELRLMFDRNYSYLMHHFINQNSEFIGQFDEWVKNNNLPDKLKMKIIINFIKNNLHIKLKALLSELKNHLENDQFIEFSTVFKHYFQWSNKNYKKIVRSSLINKIKSMKKDDNGQWINDFIKQHQQAFLKNENVAYDGGLGYFLYFSVNNPKKFARALKNACNSNFETSEDATCHFCQNKELLINRVENEKVSLYFINCKKDLVQYAFKSLES